MTLEGEGLTLLPPENRSVSRDCCGVKAVLGFTAFCIISTLGMFAGKSWMQNDDYQDLLENAFTEANREREKVMLEAKSSYEEFLANQDHDRGFLDRLNRIKVSEFPGGPGNSSTDSPSNIRRIETIYGRCRCENGLQNVTFWPEGKRDQAITASGRSIHWIQWEFHVREVHWFCNGMGFYKKTKVNLKPREWLSLQVRAEVKDFLGLGLCGKTTGMLHFNVWEETNYVSSVPFTTGTEGYACMKIPALLRTNKDTLIAFAEARTPDCDDFSRTDLVYKRSTDGGKTWSKLGVLVEVEGNTTAMGVCGHELVIGNIAPVQLGVDSRYHPNRILAPYTRNNLKSWIIHSDNDGETWTGDREIVGGTVTEKEPDCDRGMDYFGLNIDAFDLSAAGDIVKFASSLCHQRSDPFHDWADKLTGPWQFVGVGPPGAIQVSEGRVLVPGYHGYVRGLSGGKKDGKTILPTSQLYNNFALGHALISDDGGDTWRLTTDFPVGNGLNENQMVQLSDKRILLNSRSLATGTTQKRLQSISEDNGESWSASQFVDIPAPFNGCQGSTINSPDDADTVYVTSPDPPTPNTVLQRVGSIIRCKIQFTGRRKVTLFKSEDGGKSYPKKVIVDEGLSAQTSLQHYKKSLVLLYEQADPLPPYSVIDKIVEKLAGDVRILLPTRFVFRETPTDFDS